MKENQANEKSASKAELECQNAELRALLAETQAQMATFRHAMIHHLSAAEAISRNLNLIWERGEQKPFPSQEVFENEHLEHDVKRLPGLLREVIETLEIEGLSYSLIDHSVLNLKPSDIVEIANSCAENFKHRLQQKGLNLRFTVTGQPQARQIFDRHFISIIITNIFDNALHLSRSPETSLRQLFCSEVLVDIKFKPKGYRVRVVSEVTDEQHKERETLLSLVGERAAKVERRNGLGLPLSNKIVKAHSSKGVISLEFLRKSRVPGYVFSSVGFELPYCC